MKEDILKFLNEMSGGDRWSQRLIRLGRALKADREKRGFRPDIRVIGSDVDERNGILWVVLAFNPNVGRISEDDIMSIVYRYFTDFNVDWEKTAGYEKKGILCLALRPFIEKIPVKENADGSLDIPIGFKNIGASMFTFSEKDGSKSYWELIKEGDSFYLVRRDGTKPPEVIPPFEAKREKKGARIGSVVRTPDGFGIVTAVEDDRYRVKLFGQTKEIEYKDVAEYDPERDIELLRQYYRNIFPEEYVEELLK